MRALVVCLSGVLNLSGVCMQLTLVLAETLACSLVDASTVGSSYLELAAYTAIQQSELKVLAHLPILVLVQVIPSGSTSNHQTAHVALHHKKL